MTILINITPQEVNPLDFRKLSYIVALAKYQNITKAAQSLFISQPTLTKFLQNLEDELGQKLFRRLGNKLQLTYAGELYVTKAKQILALKKELDQELNDILKLNIGVLKVGFPAMRGTYMLPRTLTAYKELYPNVQLQIKEANSDILENMILNGEIDIAFFNSPIKSKSIGYETICQEEIILVLSPNHHLATCGIIKDNSNYPWLDIHLLKDEKFILPTRSQRTRQIVDDLFKQNNLPLDILLETKNIHAAVLLALEGFGATFINETHLKNVYLEGEPLYFSVGLTTTKVDFVAAFRKNSYLSYHAKEYIQVVRNFT